MKVLIWNRLKETLHRFDRDQSGLALIYVTVALPVITDGLLIDGTSQPGFSGTPLIQLNGSGIGGGDQGNRRIVRDRQCAGNRQRLGKPSGRPDVEQSASRHRNIRESE